MDGFTLPVEFVPEILPSSEVRLPSFTGHLVRAVLLNMLRQLDPSLSASLHEPNVAKGYSVAGLYFRSKARFGDGYILDPASSCTFKIRILNDEHAQTILKCFLQQGDITIAGGSFRVASVSVRSESYRDILEKAEMTDVFRLVFKSPTYLASRGAGFHHLFPEPRRLFLNLAKLWNQNARGNEIQELDEYAGWLKKNLGVTGYALETRLVRLGMKEGIGFTGWTNYRMKERDGWNKTTCALARFGEYSNIGANRTGGFGVTRFATKTPQFWQP